MVSGYKEEYLVDLKLILERVRDSSKSMQQLGSDLEEFLTSFSGMTVERPDQKKYSADLEVLINGLFCKQVFKTAKWPQFQSTIMDSFGRLKFVLCELTDKLADGVLFNMGSSGKSSTRDLQTALKRDLEVA